MKKLLAIVIVALLVLAIPASATATSLDINQVVQENDKLYVYAHLLDESGDTISGISTENVQLELGGKVLESEVTSSYDAGVAYVFAVDISCSLSEEQFDAVQECMNEWINAMGDNDYIACVSFGEYVTTEIDFSNSKNALNNVVEGLSADDDYTGLYKGVITALEIAERQDDSLPRQRAVIVLTDGENVSVDTVSKQELETKAASSGVPVYIVGVQNDENRDELTEMGEMSRESGGIIYTSDKDSITDGFTEINRYIRSGFTVSAVIPSELADGSLKGLALTANSNGVGVSNVLDVRVGAITLQEPEDTVENNLTADETEEPAPTEEPEITPEPAETEPEEEPTIAEKIKNHSGLVFIIIGAGSVGAMLIYFAVKDRKRKKTPPSPKPNPSPRPAPEPEPLTGEEGIIFEDTHTHIQYEAGLNPRISIGRGESNDINLPSKSVSRQHCELLWMGGQLYVQEYERPSTYGTTLMRSGKTVAVTNRKRTELHVGDILLLGKNTALKLISYDTESDQRGREPDDDYLTSDDSNESFDDSGDDSSDYSTFGRDFTYQAY